MDVDFEEDWNSYDCMEDDIVDLTEDDVDYCSAEEFDCIYVEAKGNKNAEKNINSSKNCSTNINKINKNVKATPVEQLPINYKRKLKVELRTISVPNETKDLIMDTLRSINGQNFSLDTDVLQCKRKLSDRYWMNQGQLIVRNCYNYSNKNNLNKDKANPLLLEKLERYGFYSNHCYEALIKMNNDFDKSLQLLLRIYFDVNFENDGELAFKKTDEMDDEIIALKSIYDKSFEDKIKYKYWLFHLELPYLAEWYFKSSFNHEPKKRTYDRTKPLCRNFNATGTCKFGTRCRFLHEIKNEQKPEENDEKKVKSSFNLEIRFPDDCNYPNDIPLIMFAAVHREFSSHICLRITKYLLLTAFNCANQGYPYCYDLVNILFNSDEILNWLNNESESKLNIDSKETLLKSDPEWVNDDIKPCASNSCSQDQRVPNKKNSICDIGNRDADVIRMMISKYRSRDYNQMQYQRKHLPASNVESDILKTLSKNQVIIIVGETGCGKSTQIPQFILDDWLFTAAGIKNGILMNERVEIICTQPRRISAIGVASRVAQERMENLGEVVGYQIRLESCISPLTKLLFCTTGILLKKIENDPFLKSTTHVIVDEVHERSEESDFLLLILKELLPVRPDLKIVLMSATMNAELFSSYFGGAPLISIPGKMFPVTEIYLEEVLDLCDYTLDEYSKQCRKINKSMSRQLDDLEYNLALADTLTRDTVCRPSVNDECLSAKQLFHRYQDYSFKTRKTLLLMDAEKINAELIVTVISWIVDGDHNYPRKGSILVFLPGLSDITAINDELVGHPVLSPRTGRFVIVPLHSSISAEEQSIIFRQLPNGIRKIVLSTNIAETSITIDDCIFVIDSGKMKETRFDANKNMSSLDTVWISKANAQQRKGRAGRIMPGLCIRLYTKHRFQYSLKSQPVPEIQRVPLDQIILRSRVLAAFKSNTIEDVLKKVLEPPESRNVQFAIEHLQNIGALDEDKELTALGRHLSVLPVDVKIGKLILFGAIFRCLDSVLTIAASLSNKSPFVSPFNKRDLAEAKKREFSIFNSDHLTVLNAYKKWHDIASRKWIAGKRFAEESFLSWRTLEMMGDLKHQYLDLLVNIGFASADSKIKRRYHEDKVLKMTSSEFNKNGENFRLLSGIICAALYPNLVEVQTPDKQYVAGVSGSMPREYLADDLKFSTRRDGFVYLHPSSVNYGVTNFLSPYLAYQEKIKTSKVFIHDSTMVTPVSLILFAGANLKIEDNAGVYIASLENGWITFTFRTLEDAKMLQQIRLEFSKLLEQKIENPYLDLIEHNTGNRIISTITDIISRTIA